DSLANRLLESKGPLVRWQRNLALRGIFTAHSCCGASLRWADVGVRPSTRAPIPANRIVHTAITAILFSCAVRVCAISQVLCMKHRNATHAMSTPIAVLLLR